MSSSRRFVRTKTLATVVGALAVIAAGPASSALGTQVSRSAEPGSAPRVAAIILPVKGDVTLIVDSKDAGDSLAFGMDSPIHRVMCGTCVAGMKRDFGIFDVGTTMVFFLRDRTHDQTYLSTNTAHARVEAVSPVKWTIHWDDGGVDGDYNDLVTSIVLSPAQAAK